MNFTAFWLAFHHLGIGFQTLRRLLEHFRTVEELWYASVEDFRQTEISTKFIEEFMRRRQEFDPQAYLQSIEHAGVTVVTVAEPTYSLLLQETHSPPLALFARGNLELLSQRCLTVVGTRKPTRYGLTATRTIVEPLAREDIVIVSGLAYGIDAAAHQAALAGNGRTIAVLGNGIDQIYPAGNRELGQAILKNRGLIISEHPPGTEPQRHFFPQRNRILAGLSTASLIVEAGEKSGALITARMALDENREVFAVPGPIDGPTSVGPNNLIKLGASVASRADDLRESLGLDIPRLVEKNAEVRADSPAEAAILPLLKEPRHIDELTTISRLETSVVNATLSLLEMNGRVRHLGGMHYIRVS